jgi:hypothetical protein
MQDVELELRRLYRKRAALNQLIRACEEYGLVGGAEKPAAAAEALIETHPAPVPRKPNVRYFPGPNGKQVLA